MIYDDVDLSEFMKIEDIRRSILPAQNPVFAKVKGRSVFIETDNDVGLIDVDVRIISSTRRNTLKHIRENIAKNIYKTEPKKAIFHDEPDKHCFLILSGATDLKRFLYTASATLEFIAPDPLFYSNAETEIVSAAPFTAISGINQGTAVSRGKINFVIEDAPETFNVMLQDTLGVISLRARGEISLNGAWEIDLYHRTVKKDGVLAGQHIIFENTDFQEFVIKPGEYTILFSCAVSSGSYRFNAAYL